MTPQEQIERDRFDIEIAVERACDMIRYHKLNSGRDELIGLLYRLINELEQRDAA